MKNLFFTFFIISINLNLVAQNSFKDFIDLFPNYKWDSIPEDIRDFKKADTIDIDKANEYMWEDHASISIVTQGYSYSRPAPHFMHQDGSYDKGDEGMFDKTTICGDTGAISKLQPLGKINVSSNIVMLLLFYRYWDPDNGWMEFYEAYTYRLNDEKLISSLCLWNNKELRISFKKPDNSFDLYLTRYSQKNIEEYEAKKSIFKISYKLRIDGYFQQINSVDVEKQGLVFWVAINDSKGFSEVHSKPIIDSQVLYKAINKKPLLVEKLNGTDWYKVICYMYKGKEYHEGFIHKSRLNKIEKE
jgi:hypothetical protein